MTFFIIWIGVIALALTLYSLSLWRQSQRYSRFRARLTILFFLIVLIPTVPLTFFVSILLTKSTEMFMLPGIEKALSNSIDVLRMQLDENCAQFFADYPDLRSVPQTTLVSKRIKYLSQITLIDGNPNITYYATTEPAHYTQKNILSTIPLELIKNQQRHGEIVAHKPLPLYQYYQMKNDSTLFVVGVELPEKISKAKNEISFALRNYASFTLLRDTFIEKGVIWTIAAVFITLLAFLAVYSAHVLSRGIGEPIQQLVAGMRQVGAGNLSHQVEAKAKDEIAFLVESFNKMTRELKISRENLQRAERAAAWRDVARQVSHEIKNPLTPMRFSLHRLRSTLPEAYLQNKDVDEALRILEEEISSMRRVAEEFSQFARMPSMELKPEDINETIVSSTQLFAQQEEVNLILDLASDIPPVLLDREQFRRVIHNLVKNAMEASKPKSDIHIRTSEIVRDKKCFVTVEIIDHGEGMDEATLEKATQPYFTTKEKGTGLGLFIVSRIIKDHNGTMHIQSRKGEGTSIILTLPES